MLRIKSPAARVVDPEPSEVDLSPDMRPNQPYPACNAGGAGHLCTRPRLVVPRADEHAAPDFHAVTGQGNLAWVAERAAARESALYIGAFEVDTAFDAHRTKLDIPASLQAVAVQREPVRRTDRDPGTQRPPDNTEVPAYRQLAGGDLLSAALLQLDRGCMRIVELQGIELAVA